jgi:uncharacterized protein (DUF3084 family)
MSSAEIQALGEAFEGERCECDGLLGSLPASQSERQEAIEAVKLRLRRLEELLAKIEQEAMHLSSEDKAKSVVSRACRVKYNELLVKIMKADSTITYDDHQPTKHRTSDMIFADDELAGFKGDAEQTITEVDEETPEDEASLQRNKRLENQVIAGLVAGFGLFLLVCCLLYFLY